MSNPVELARFLVAEEVGMARASLMEVERVVPVRVLVLRERVDADEAGRPGRVARTAVRRPDDPALEIALRHVDFSSFAAASVVPAGFRDRREAAGTTAPERAWMDDRLAEWSADSGREVPVTLAVHEEELVVLRASRHRRAVVATRRRAVLAWIEDPPWWELLVSLAAAAGASGLVGLLAWGRMDVETGGWAAGLTFSLALAVIVRSLPGPRAVDAPRIG